MLSYTRLCILIFFGTYHCPCNRTCQSSDGFYLPLNVNTYRRKVLRLSSGIDEPGIVKWDLLLCLLLAWIVVYFCIWKGIRSSGKVICETENKKRKHGVLNVPICILNNNYTSQSALPSPSAPKNENAKNRKMAIV